MEKLIDLLKPLVEKYLFPTIASVALAILGVAFLPDALKLKGQIGNFFYGVLLFCICFLAINLIKYLVAYLKHVHNKNLANKQQYQELESERLEKLWDFVDSLSPLDRSYLLKFIKNGNEPIEVIKSSFDIGLLSNNSVIVSTEKNIELGNNKNIALDEEDAMKFHLHYNNIFNDSQSFKLFKLRDNFYELLKYSYDKYGKISHFDFKESQNGQDEDAHAE